jgi:hypothetical protein
VTPLVVARKLMASRSQQSSEGDPHPLTIVAADLKAIGAPAAVALIDSDASIMSPLDAAGMAIEQQVVTQRLGHDCREGSSPSVRLTMLGRTPQLRMVGSC